MPWHAVCAVRRRRRRAGASCVSVDTRRRHVATTRCARRDSDCDQPTTGRRSTSDGDEPSSCSATTSDVNDSATHRRRHHRSSHFHVTHTQTHTRTHAHTRLTALFPGLPSGPVPERYKKLSYRRGTARCVVSVEILPVATQQCRNYLYDKS